LSDKTIVELIRHNYIAAVGEHYQLTRGPMREWWAQVVSSVRPNGPSGSTQGYYVVRADGSGIISDNYPPRLKMFLERGLALARGAEGQPAEVSATELQQFAPRAMPDGAFVIRLFTRARLSDGSAAPNAYLNRDYMWILGEEVQAILDSAGRSKTEFSLPSTLTARLVLFHMVDGTRGAVWPYQPKDISRAQLTARSTGREGAVQRITFSGQYAKRDSHPPQWNDRGQEGDIAGELEINWRTKKLTRFRAYAESQAWSDATYDPRRPPFGRYQLITAMIESTDELDKQIAPEPATTGNYYLGPQLAIP
jgi:hypothetical protein